MAYTPKNPNGQATMAASEPVVIASNQTAIPVSGTFYQATQPVSLASVPSHAVTNAGTFAVQAAQSGAYTVGLSADQTLATVTTVSTVTNLSQLNGTAINMNAGTVATGTQRVVVASSATGTQTNPSLSTTSATLLAASTSRRGATVYNNSASVVYVRLSATAASATTFTVKLLPTAYYEVPGYYNGAITAILDTGTTTAVQVTQIT